jgi:hypothetical protein
MTSQTFTQELSFRLSIAAKAALDVLTISSKGINAS